MTGKRSRRASRCAPPSAVNTNRTIREADHGRSVGELLVQEAITEGDNEQDNETLSEAEFLKAVLVRVAAS